MVQRHAVQIWAGGAKDDLERLVTRCVWAVLLRNEKK